MPTDDMSQQQHVRKTFAGVCMFLAPLVALAAWVLAPPLRRDEIEALDEIAAASGRATLSLILDVISLALAVFAVLGVVHLVRERGGYLGQAGGVLTIVGMVGVVLNTGIQAAAIEIAERGAAEGAGLYGDILTGPVGIAGIASGALVTVGILALAFATFRAEAVPVVSSVLVALFAVGQFIGFMTFTSPIVVASFVALTAGLWPIGYQVLTETDEAWEHTPRFRGFHAIPTA